jgi:hypothetical protein
MGSATSDIVARLQLNAQQFSSATGQAFADMRTRAQSTAQEVRSSFNSSFAEVQRIAQGALTLPRNVGGSLDLSSEITQLKESAAAAQQRATALTELSVAQTEAASSAGVDAERMRLDADASAVAALAEERNVQAIRDRIVALEAVQTSLNRSTSATKADVAAVDQVTQHTQKTSIAKMELMHVVRAGSDAFAAGAPITQIFAQEIGRLGEAAALSGGSMGKLGAFLGSGWGLAVTAGLAILGPFVAKIFESGDAAHKASDSFDAWGDSQTLLGKVMDLTTGKMKTQNEVVRESVRLQALLNQEQAKKDLGTAQQDINGTRTTIGLRAFGFGPASGQAMSDAFAGKSFGDSPELRSYFQQVNSGAIGAEEARKKLQELEHEGKTAGQLFDDLFPKVLKVLDARERKDSSQATIDALDGKGLDPRLVPYKKPKQTRDQTRESEAAAEEIARINSEWDLQPKLIDRAANETLKLNNLIADLERRKPPGFEKLIADANAAKQAIQNGLDRPFTDFLQKQRENIGVERLLLQGREAEAAALQDALRLQDQQGRVTSEQLATLLKVETTQQKIRDALDDQRRVVGLYGQAVGNVQRDFENFLNGLQSKPGPALKGLTSGLLADFKSLQSALVGEQLFGGMQREIERWVAQRAGGSTPADLLKDQVLGVGTVWTKHVNDNGSALDALTKAFLSAANTFSKAGPAAANDNGSTAGLGSAAGAQAPSSGAAGGEAAQDEIVITGRRVSDSFGQSATKVLSAAELFNHVGSSLVDNFEHLLGVKLPASLDKTLKDSLGSVLAGASFGQLGGSIFQSLGGGKDDKLASGIGGALGKKAGDMLGKPIADAIGGTLGKTLGGFAGPLGGILGGIAGDFLGSLFASKPHGASTISSGANGLSASAGFGNNAAANTAANGEANTIIQGIGQVAQALGASVSAFSGITVGSYKGNYRVRTDGGTQLGGYSGSAAQNQAQFGLYDFGTDQAAAIQFAIAESIQKGVITGISQASVNIIKSGQDLSTAITKAELIESIPRDLKAMTDPVGKAIDDLNRKWSQTVAALKEGGATTEQMAQAQDLYNRQLAQVKASTDAADASLQSFKKNLVLGSSSPYSLRDQETTAKAALQPYLDTISAGGTIDQQKYQDAAQAFLDIERQLYGSTEQYFAALDQIQAATNKAIETIDNATPIASNTSDPFASSTASATQQTANNTATGNQLLSQLSDQMAQLNQTLSSMANDNSDSPSFIGTQRGF